MLLNMSGKQVLFVFKKDLTLSAIHMSKNDVNIDKCLCFLKSIQQIKTLTLSSIPLWPYWFISIQERYQVQDLEDSADVNKVWILID